MCKIEPIIRMILVYLVAFFTAIPGSMANSSFYEKTEDPEYVNLLVKVRDGKSKNALEGVTVKVFQRKSFSFASSTEKTGEFQHLVILNKEYMFVFSKPEYITKSISLSSYVPAKLLNKLVADYTLEVSLSKGETTDEHIATPSARISWNPPDVSRFSEKSFDMDKLSNNEELMQVMNLFLDNYYKEKNKYKATDVFEERLKKKVEDENIKLKAEIERLKKEADEREQQQAETELLKQQAEETKNLIAEIERLKKESAERTKSMNEEERAKKEQEEKARVAAEIERLTKEAEKKKQLELEIAQLKREAEERTRLDAALRAKADAEFERQEAEEAAKRKAEEEEKARLEAEIQRLKKEQEEKERLKAEMENLKKEAAEKKQLEAEIQRIKNEQKEKEKLLAAAKTKPAVGSSTPVTPTISPAEAKKRAEAERLKKEQEEKARLEAAAKAKAEEERLKKAMEEKARMEAEARAKEEAEMAAREAEFRIREKEAAALDYEDCDKEQFLDKCNQRLGDFSFLKSFKIDNKFNTEPKGIQYNIVCTKGAHYMLTVCSGLGGRMVVTIFDNDKKLVASSLNKKTKKHLSKIDFIAAKTGVYYFNFAFENEIGCGLSILGLKK